MGVIAVKVNPKARLNKVEDDGAGGLVVWTTAPPDKGAANEAVARLIADYLGVRASAVSLYRGATSRRKLFQVDD